MKCFICGNNVKLPAGIKTEDVKSSGASTSLRTTPTLRAFGLSMSAYERIVLQNAVDGGGEA
jgi:hypothetical protein